MFWISIVASTAYLVLLMGKAVLAQLESARQKMPKQPSECGLERRRVAVLQPILSGDSMLPVVLRTNAEELSSQAILFWAIDDTDSEGLRMAAELLPRFASVKLVRCPAAPPGKNPKLFKLQWVAESIRETFDVFVVLDDDTLLDGASLRVAVQRIFDQGREQLRGDGTQAVGPREQPPRLFTGLPYYATGGNFWSQLVASFVNNNSALTYLPLLHFLPPISINGMFYGVPAQPFLAAGGFGAVDDWLCDDYAIKKHLSQQGWELEQGVVTAQVQTRVRDGRHYIQLLHRWMVFGRLLFADQTPAMQVLLALVLAMPPFLLTVAVIAAGNHWVAWSVLAFVLAMRWWTIQQLQWVVFGKRLLHPVYSLLAEILQPWHVLHSLVQRTIQWRCHRIVAESANRFRVVG